MVDVSPLHSRSKVRTYPQLAQVRGLQRVPWRKVAPKSGPKPWTENITTALVLSEKEIDNCKAELRSLGADRPYVSLLQSVPDAAWVLGFTIASEIDDIGRFTSPKQLVGYVRLCPRV